MAPAPALASAGFWCETTDASVVFTLEGGLSRSIPGPPFSFQGALTVSLSGAPDDFREMTLSADDLAQSWIDGGDLWLEIYRERAEGEFASISLIIKTALEDDEEMTFNGTYALSIFAVPPEGGDAVDLTAEGSTTCSVG